MNIGEIINKKRLNKSLTDEEIKYVIDEYMKENIEDYQLSALLMAMELNDMSNEEVLSLTKHISSYGDIINLSPLGINVVNIDAINEIDIRIILIVLSIVSSCGIKVPKIDNDIAALLTSKLPGFTQNSSFDEFIKQLNQIGVAIMPEDKEYSPAEKKIKDLCNKIGLTDSIPLIASLVIAKHIHIGTKKLILNIKVRESYLGKNKESAKRLAKLLVELGKHNHIEVVCFIINNDELIGTSIGLPYEISEVTNILNKNKYGKLRELCLDISSHMVSLGLNISYKDAQNIVIEELNKNNSINRFNDIINYHHVSLSSLQESKNKYEIKSMTEGYLTNIDVDKLNILLMQIKDNNNTEGIIIHKNINEYINKNDIIMTVYSNNIIKNIDNSIFKIGNKTRTNIKQTYEIIK